MTSGMIGGTTRNAAISSPPKRSGICRLRRPRIRFTTATPVRAMATAPRKANAFCHQLKRRLGPLVSSARKINVSSGAARFSTSRVAL